MTIESIMAVITAIVTYVFAEINKKFKLTDTNYLPLQNLTVGFLTGLIVWACGLHEKLFSSIVVCTISAFGAGGFYDLSKTGSVENEDK